MRGLNAPPRKSVAPLFLTSCAMVQSCSSLSIEHGPGNHMEKTFARFLCCLSARWYPSDEIGGSLFYRAQEIPLDVFNNFVRLERIDIYAGSIAYQADDGRLLAFAVVGFEPKRFHGFEQGGDLLFFCLFDLRMTTIYAQILSI